MTPEEIRNYIKAVARRSDDPSLEAVREALAGMKREAVVADDQPRAKSIWCLEQALTVQDHYLQAFKHLVAGEFYQAWCALEQTEMALANLERHDMDSWPEFRLDFIRAHTAKGSRSFPTNGSTVLNSCSRRSSARFAATRSCRRGSADTASVRSTTARCATASSPNSK
jgi:hypothetical protein